MSPRGRKRTPWHLGDSPSDSTDASNQGSIHVFDLGAVTPGVWSETKEMDDPEGASDDALGGAVDLDGNRVLAGARFDDGGGTDRGAAHVFDRFEYNGAGATIIGIEGPDTLTGGAFNDVIGGGRHADLLVGGRNNDTLTGNSGNDTAQGGPGTDTCSAETEQSCEA